eukprot:8888065-Karenia_brevis.AAC.1
MLGSLPGPQAGKQLEKASAMSTSASMTCGETRDLKADATVLGKVELGLKCRAAIKAKLCKSADHTS